MSERTPVTASGRSLFSRMWEASEYAEFSRITASVMADILRIEDEAQAAADLDVESLVHCIRQDCEHFDAAKCIRALRAAYRDAKGTP